MNVIFDIGNVLLSYQPQTLFRGYALYPNVYAQIQEIFTSPEWGMLDQGLITDAQAASSLAQRLPLLGSKGVQNILDNWVYGMKPIPGAEALVKKLTKQGINCYYLSNFPMEQWAYILRAHPLFRYFKGGLASWQVKMVKPNADIYLAFLEQTQLKAETCVFTDDMQRNVYGAQSVGIDSFPFLCTQQCEKELKKRGILK